MRLTEDDTDAIAEQVGGMRNSVDKGYSQLFNALQDEVPVEDFAFVAETTYLKTGPLRGLIARLLGGYLAIAQIADDPEECQKQLQTMLEATEWQSRVGLIHSYLAYARANMQSHDVNRWYADEKKRVATRKLASEVPQGTVMSVEQIVQDASLNVGDMFHLEGIVTNLRIEDDPRPPKFSSFFELTNLISGNAIKVRAHMFSLLANGVSNGAYCRLNGILRRGESWLETGVVGIDIDRVNLSELRKDSWIDDVTFRMRPHHTLYFDEMNMFYTPLILTKGGN